MRGKEITLTQGAGVKPNNRVLQDWSLFLYLSKTFPKHVFHSIDSPSPFKLYKHTERQAAAAGSYNAGLW